MPNRSLLKLSKMSIKNCFKNNCFQSKGRSRTKSMSPAPAPAPKVRLRTVPAWWMPIGMQGGTKSFQSVTRFNMERIIILKIVPNWRRIRKMWNWFAEHCSGPTIHRIQVLKIYKLCPDTIPLYKWTDYYLKKPYFMNEILLDRMQHWQQQKQQLWTMQCLSIIITLQGNCCYNSVLSSLWSTHRKSITNKEAKIIEL